METRFSNRRSSQWLAQIAGIKKADLLRPASLLKYRFLSLVW